MKPATVTIRLTELPSVREKLDDIRDLICALSSEGWDLLSDETRNKTETALSFLDFLIEAGT